MPELIIGCFSAPSGKGTALQVNTPTQWGKADQVDINVKSHINNGEVVNCTVTTVHSKNTVVDTTTKTARQSTLLATQSTVTTKNLGVYSYDVIASINTPNDLQHIDSITKLGYSNILPKRDVSSQHNYYGVHKLSEKPKPPGDYKYLPNTNFEFDNTLIGFTADFIEPLDFDKLTTPLSPVGLSNSFPWSRTKTKDTQKSLTYGYGINNFLVGGGTQSNYPIDPDAVDPEDGGSYEPEPNEHKVITIVNTVTVVKLPERTPLLFSNVTLSKHIDSFSWDCSVTLLNKSSYDLIKPSATETQTIEITVNGTVWEFFIGKTRKVKQFGNITYVATGYSHSAKLQEPYAATNNYSNTSGALASQLIDNVLSGTGYTSIWSMPVNWPVATNGFTYQNKSPIDAVAQIASAAGAVIEPDLVSKTITIKPWATTSAWQWQDLIDLPVIDEALSFDLTEQYTPQDQANAVYVSGNNNGVLLKGKLSGTAGDKLLPTVTDSLITDTAVATERARIELSKSGHKENVPITTFIDSEETLLMPGDMVTINMSDEPNWNGLINNISINVNNAGVEVNQQLSVIRHYEKS